VNYVAEDLLKNAASIAANTSGRALCLMQERLSPTAGRAALTERTSQLGKFTWLEPDANTEIADYPWCGRLIAIAETGQFIVREVLAAFLLFCVLFGLLGITVLGFVFIGGGVVRSFDLLATSGASFCLRRPVTSVAGPLKRRIGKG
jgi:hypothetical protein